MHNLIMWCVQVFTAREKETMARTRKVLGDSNGPRAGRQSDPGPGAPRRRGRPSKKTVELDSEGEELVGKTSSDSEPPAGLMDAG